MAMINAERLKEKVRICGNALKGKLSIVHIGMLIEQEVKQCQENKKQKQKN